MWVNAVGTVSCINIYDIMFENFLSSVSKYVARIRMCMLPFKYAIKEYEITETESEYMFLIY